MCIRDRHKVVETLVPFSSNTNEAVAATALRLLFNLSFDPELRGLMLDGGLLPKLVSLLKRKTHLMLVLRLLYNLSAESEGRAAICNTDTHNTEPTPTEKRECACFLRSIRIDVGGMRGCGESLFAPLP